MNTDAVRLWLVRPLRPLRPAREPFFTQRREDRKEKKRRLFASASLPENRKRLIHPFLFVIELPMTCDPLLGRFHRDVLPFLQVSKNRKGRQRFAGIALHTDHFGRDLDQGLFLVQDAKLYLASHRRQDLEIHKSARFADIFRSSKNV